MGRWKSDAGTVIEIGASADGSASLELGVADGALADRIEGLDHLPDGGHALDLALSGRRLWSARLSATPPPGPLSLGPVTIAVSMALDPAGHFDLVVKSPGIPDVSLVLERIDAQGFSDATTGLWRALPGQGSLQRGAVDTGRPANATAAIRDTPSGIRVSFSPEGDPFDGSGRRIALVESGTVWRGAAVSPAGARTAIVVKLLSQTSLRLRVERGPFRAETIFRRLEP